VPEPWLDKPLQFMIALAMLVGFLAWRVRAHHRPSLQRRPLWLKALVATLETLVALVLVLVASEGTRHVGADVCLELIEGHQWCNGPDGAGRQAD
jgi:hypothetical protein